MVFDDHVRRGHPFVFGFITLVSLIELIITAILVHDDNSNGGLYSHTIRDRERFLLFTSLWTILFSIFYIVGFLKASGSFLLSIASHGIWLFITWVVLLAGAAAITDTLGGSATCGRFGLPHCHQLTATEAFAWINWILLTFAFFIVVFTGARSMRSGDGFGGPLVRV